MSKDTYTLMLYIVVLKIWSVKCFVHKLLLRQRRYHQELVKITLLMDLKPSHNVKVSAKLFVLIHTARPKVILHVAFSSILSSNYEYFFYFFLFCGRASCSVWARHYVYVSVFGLRRRSLSPDDEFNQVQQDSHRVRAHLYLFADVLHWRVCTHTLLVH